MPKAIRTPKDIEAVKQTILDAALDIFIQEGFALMSMRKIATKAQMTAANIYNYYSNKDEIYLAIQTQGFAELYLRFKTLDESMPDSVEKLKQFTAAYLAFGIENPELYEIMFTRNTPKFIDYVGTQLEPTAVVEKQTALQVIDLSCRLIETITQDIPSYTTQQARYRTIQHWTALHGIVSLYNSRVLHEAADVSESTLEKLTQDLMLPFLNELPPST